ncbi:MAG: hypothetical protein J5I92_10380 [Thiogranum sp.]|nr:hypothetical protein [Thiogranum sp.]
MKRRPFICPLRNHWSGDQVTPTQPPWFMALKSVFPAVLLVVATSLADDVSGEQSLEMDGMAVIGNRELPKALFIVPWKDPESAMAPDRPINTLIDEALQPVDPDVFRRKLQYYDLVHKKD